MDNILYKKRKRRQKTISIITTFFFSLLIIFLLIEHENILAYSLLFGLIIGFAMQKSKICFTAAFRNPFLFGMTKLSKAVVASLILTTIAFALIQFYRIRAGIPAGGKFLIPGVYIPIGAFIFGLGASVSGGCASGTLFRLGEGYQLQYFVVVGFLLGSLRGGIDQSFWNSLTFGEEIIYFPEKFGWIGGISLQLFLLLLIYLYLIRIDNSSLIIAIDNFKKKFIDMKIKDININFKSFITNPFKYLSYKIWPYWVGTLILAVTNIIYFFITGRYWRISSGFMNLIFWFLALFGFDFANINFDIISPFNDPIFWSNLGIIFGSFISILLAGHFKIKKFKNKKQVVIALIGGFLMGYGSRVASGCNIGGFYSAVSSLALNGWLYLPFVVLGIYLGSKLLSKFAA